MKRFSWIRWSLFALTTLLMLEQPIQLQAQASAGIRVLIRAIRGARPAGSALHVGTTAAYRGAQTFGEQAARHYAHQGLVRKAAGASSRFLDNAMPPRYNGISTFELGSTRPKAYDYMSSFMEKDFSINDIILRELSNHGRKQLNAGSFNDRLVAYFYLREKHAANRHLMKYIETLNPRESPADTEIWNMIIDSLNEDLPYSLKVYLDRNPEMSGNLLDDIDGYYNYGRSSYSSGIRLRSSGPKTRTTKTTGSSAAARSRKARKTARRESHYKKLDYLSRELNYRLYSLSDELQVEQLYFNRKGVNNYDLLEDFLGAYAKEHGLPYSPIRGGEVRTIQQFTARYDNTLKHLQSRLTRQHLDIQWHLHQMGFLTEKPTGSFVDNKMAQEALTAYAQLKGGSQFMYLNSYTFDFVDQAALNDLKADMARLNELFSELGFSQDGDLKAGIDRVSSYLSIAPAAKPKHLTELNNLLTAEKQWLDEALDHGYIDRHVTGQETGYLVKRPNDVYEWVTRHAEGRITRVKDARAFEQLDMALNHQLNRASGNNIQFARISGFANGESKTVNIRFGELSFEVYHSDLRAFLNEEKSEIRDVLGDSFDEWIRRKLPEASHVVFYQDPVLGSMNFTYEANARLLTEVKNINGTGQDIYNPQKLVALLNAHYGEGLSISLTNDLERARYNLSHAPGKLTADDIALSHDLEIEDYGMRKRIQKRIEKSKMNKFELGSDLSNYKALIFSGHKNENFRKLLNDYGQRGDLKDKVIVLLTCHDQNEVALMNSLLGQYGARQVIIYDQKLNGGAVEESLVALMHKLKKQGFSAEMLSMVREAVMEVYTKVGSARKGLVEPLKHNITGVIPE